MDSRPGRGRRKTQPAVGRLIRSQLGQLHPLAALLNGGWAGWAWPEASEEDRTAARAAADTITAIAEAMLGVPADAELPSAVVDHFNRLAETAPFIYQAHPAPVYLTSGEPDPGNPRTWHTSIVLRNVVQRGQGTAGERGRRGDLYRATLSALTLRPWGHGVLLLADYLVNPHRDRLRRCPQCHRWFVDQTRNRSAARCSRACTIGWWHAKRKEPR
jgi:hypothetical protein